MKKYIIAAIIFVIVMALTSAFALLEWDTPMWIGISILIVYIMGLAISIIIHNWKHYKESNK
jgi:hypothetical protein